MKSNLKTIKKLNKKIKPIQVLGFYTGTEEPQVFVDNLEADIAKAQELSNDVRINIQDLTCFSPNASEVLRILKDKGYPIKFE